MKHRDIGRLLRARPERLPTQIPTSNLDSALSLYNGRLRIRWESGGPPISVEIVSNDMAMTTNSSSQADSDLDVNLES
jgi:hypothetical protein